MAGAKFTIKDKDDVVIGSFEYGANGKITNTKGVITLDGNYATIKGVDEGTYTITEEQAPNGYAVLGSGVEIEITVSYTRRRINSVF
ncbi:MAG: prealbumin-like fold domain-containing protein [Lachnospiraceae bacterium]|nr:prealbumin-like fold domain-containing protein [Lachnospiraceae bacterium]